MPFPANLTGTNMVRFMLEVKVHDRDYKLLTNRAQGPYQEMLARCHCSTVRAALGLHKNHREPIFHSTAWARYLLYGPRFLIEFSGFPKQKIHCF